MFKAGGPDTLRFVPERPTAVLFDLDGTLLDTMGDLANSVNRLRSRRGLPSLSDRAVAGFVGDGPLTLMERVLPGLSRPELEAAEEEFLDDYLAHCTERTQPYPGIPEALDGLAGIPLGIVTNKPRNQTMRLVDSLGWRARFGAILASDDLERIKPDPLPIRTALERLGAEASGAWMIGDSTNDVEAGKAAGVRTILVSWGFQPLENVLPLGPDAVARTPREIPGIVFGRTSS